MVRFGDKGHAARQTFFTPDRQLTCRRKKISSKAALKTEAGIRLDSKGVIKQGYPSGRGEPAPGDQAGHKAQKYFAAGASPAAVISPSPSQNFQLVTAGRDVSKNTSPPKRLKGARPKASSHVPTTPKISSAGSAHGAHNSAPSELSPCSNRGLVDPNNFQSSVSYQKAPAD